MKPSIASRPLIVSGAQPPNAMTSLNPGFGATSGVAVSVCTSADARTREARRAVRGAEVVRARREKDLEEASMLVLKV